MKNVFIVLLIFAVSAPAMARGPKRNGHISAYIPNFQNGSIVRDMWVEMKNFKTPKTRRESSARSDAEKIIKSANYKSNLVKLVCGHMLNSGKTLSIKHKVKHKSKTGNLSSVSVTCSPEGSGNLGGGTSTGNLSFKCPATVSSQAGSQGFSGSKSLKLVQHDLQAGKAKCIYGLDKIQLVKQSTSGCRKLNTLGDFSCSQK